MSSSWGSLAGASLGPKRGGGGEGAAAIFSSWGRRAGSSLGSKPG